MAVTTLPARRRRRSSQGTGRSCAPAMRSSSTCSVRRVGTKRVVGPVQTSSTLSSRSTRRRASEAPRSMPATSSPLACTCPHAANTRATAARAAGVSASVLRCGAAPGVARPRSARRNGANLRGRDESYQVYDCVEERLHQIPVKKAASVDLERRDDERAVEVAVAALARRLGDERARVARGGVQRRVRPRVVFGAERVGRADLRAIERLPKQAPEVLGLAEVDEAAERAVGVGRCRVDQDARLRLAVFGVGVDALADARRVVAAIERELADEQVRDRVKHREANAGKAGVGLEPASRAPATVSPAQLGFLRSRPRPLAHFTSASSRTGGRCLRHGPAWPEPSWARCARSARAAHAALRRPRWATRRA